MPTGKKLTYSVEVSSVEMGLSGSLPVKINTDGTDELEVRGYRVHRGRCALACLALVVSFGLLLIPLLWRKDIKMWMFYKECPLQHASKVLVKVKQQIRQT